MKKKTEAKRQAIVDIAAEVFRELGFEGASMSEICRRVGGSKATIYNYFSSKELLFFEVMHQANHAQFVTIHAMLDLEAGDVGEALRRFGEALSLFIYSPDVMAIRRLVMTNACNGSLGQTCFELGPRRSMDEISEFLRSAIERGQLVRVLEDWCPVFEGYHLYYPSRRQNSPLFQALVACLKL